MMIARKSSFPVRFVIIFLATIAVIIPLLALIPSASGQIGGTFSATTTMTSSGPSSSEIGLGLIGAGIAIAGSCIGAGIAVGKAAGAAAAAIVERPATFGSLLILAGLGEGIAIYGLLIAFQILSKVP